MSDLSHLRLEDSPRTLAYSYAGPTPRAKPFELPPRDRVPHAQQLAASLRQAEAEVAAIRQTHPAADEALDGVPITLRSDAGCKLPLPSTERRRDGMELLSVHTDPSGVTTANLFVRRDKVVNLLRDIERYEKEDTTRTLKDGTVKTRPKNENLIRSIASIRLLAIRDLWTEGDCPWPPSDQALWWEVWARRGEEAPSAAFARLRDAAQAVEARVSSRFVHFPERVVTLVYGSAQQLGSSLDFLAATAELRRAKEVPTAYLELAARDQREFVDDAARRLQPPGKGAPAVCLLAPV